MTGPLVVALAIVAAGGGEDRSPDRAAYEAARKGAGSDAAAQVRLALWCEQHGMTAERMKHLAAAVLADPSNALARGLMGLVAQDGKWERPDDVSREAKDDPKRKALMDEYLQRRAKTSETADAHLKLATWCDQNGLKPQAAAHFQRVIKLDPRRDAAWRHLGFKKSGGHWVKPELVAAARARAQEQQKADKHWKPILERYRSALQSKSPTRRADAEEALAKITEPDAVPMPAAVTSIERGEVVLVYNLDVAEDSDFFVGRGGALVHDNTLPDLREKSFDAAGPLVAENPAARPRSMLGR
jgi:tetratricopeptide (TPR) repeat protein